MDLSLSINLILHSNNAHRRPEIAPRLMQFFNTCLAGNDLSMIQTSDVFRFVDLDLQVTKKIWNLLGDATFLELDIAQI